MLELIALVCAAGLMIWTPIETRKVARGWVRPRHKGTPEQFRIQYRKQLSLFVWLGLAIGLFNIGFALMLEDDQARGLVKLVAGLVWLGAALSCFLSRRHLDAAPR
jgi:hypothetical protein